MDTNIVSCALSSETIHLKLDVINSSIALLLSNIPRIPKALPTKKCTQNMIRVYVKQIFSERKRAEDNIALSTQNLYKDKTNQSRSKHKYTSKG